MTQPACAECAAPFVPHGPGHVYCGPACSNRRRQRRAYRVRCRRGPSPIFARLTLMMDEPPLAFCQAVVWDKGGLGLGWRYRRNYEFVLVAQIKGRKLPWYDDTDKVANVIRLNKIIPSSDEHPTVKPTGLMERFIALHTKPGDLVLDPFMGSGTTLRVAKNLGRRAVGIDLDERWCALAVRRLSQEALPLYGDAAS